MLSLWLPVCGVSLETQIFKKIYLLGDAVPFFGKKRLLSPSKEKMALFEFPLVFSRLEVLEYEERSC